MTTKRKLSISLDEELVRELEAGDESISAQLNDVLRSEVVRRRRAALLAELLDRLDDELGPVDEALVERYEILLR